MAMPSPREDTSKEKLNNLLEQLENEFRWCAQHPNDVSDIELEQLMQAVDELEENAKIAGGKFYKDFTKFRKKFDHLAKNPKEINLGDFQIFDDMIQELFRDLK